jgi:serine/threonine protein kinase
MAVGSEVTHGAVQQIDPLLGRALDGRFTLLELIGIGGMGRVYKAIQAPLDRLVAVKVLSPSYDAARDPGFRERFALEASLTAKLRHPNTISIYDHGQTADGVFFIAMEWLEGQTLAEVVAHEGPLPWQRCVGIAQQICRSLREAHRLGLIHRDLKPANVMLLAHETDQDLVKVLDFGLVKTFDGSSSITDTAVTQGNIFLGSPLYMAPEQARNQASPRSDIYSLGVMMFQMLAGRTPFTARDSIDLIVQHVYHRPPSINEVRPGTLVPPEIEAVLRRCLEKDPSARYASMDELLEALRWACEAAGASGLFSGPRAMSTGTFPALQPPSIEIDLSVSEVLPVPQERDRQRWLLPLGALLGAALLGLAGALLFWNPPSAPEPKAIAVAPAAAPAPVEEPAARPLSKVRFRVSTIPSGAVLWRDGKRLGRTPLSFEVMPRETGDAVAELHFALDGYHPLRFTAGGYGPEVVLIQRMQRKSEPVRSPPVEVLPAAPAPVQVPAVTGAVAGGASPSAAPAAAGPAPTAPPAPVPEALPVASAPAPAPASTSPAPSTEPAPASAAMTRPELLDSGRAPAYTREALASRVEGVVSARCVVTVEGRLERCALLKSLPHMERSILDSLSTRRYRPALLGGRPHAVEYVLNLRVAPPR